LREAKLDAIGFTWMVVGGTAEDAPVECVSSRASGILRPEEVRSGAKVKIENTGPDSITSGYK
jgi:hypothetical protein